MVFTSLDLANLLSGVCSSRIIGNNSECPRQCGTPNYGCWQSFGLEHTTQRRAPCSASMCCSILLLKLPDTFVWVSGTSNYTDWHVGEPNSSECSNETERCGSMTSDGTWDDTFCDNLYYSKASVRMKVTTLPFPLKCMSSEWFCSCEFCVCAIQ